jgi:hypothetical protein
MFTFIFGWNADSIFAIVGTFMDVKIQMNPLLEQDRAAGHNADFRKRGHGYVFPGRRLTSARARIKTAPLTTGFISVRSSRVGAGSQR